MATKKKTKTKKDLEAKIAELEGKLSQLSAQLAQKPAEAKAPPPPPPKPAEQAKAPPPPPPKPAEQAKAAPPATRESLIESLHPVGIWHDRKSKTPGYTPENPRAWANRHAEGADAPTTPWGLQKTKVPGYTAPSNKYFATRQRLASLPGGRLSYHPELTQFSGYGISLGQVQAQTAPPPPPPKPATRGRLPKGF